MNTLKAEKRDLSVKAKKLRREGFVTGNLFGRKIESSIPIKINKKDLGKLLSVERKGSQIMLSVDDTTYDALIKDIEYDVISRDVNEIDFQALVSDEKVHSTMEVICTNGDKISNGVLQLCLSEIPFKAYPSALISEIKIDVGHLKLDEVIRVKDLEIYKNPDIDFTIDPEAVVACVHPVHNEIPAEPVSTETSDATAAAPATETSKNTK